MTTYLGLVEGFGHLKRADQILAQVRQGGRQAPTPATLAELRTRLDEARQLIDTARAVGALA